MRQGRIYRRNYKIYDLGVPSFMKSKKLLTKSCKICEKEFKTWNKNKKTCSNKCSHALQREHKKNCGEQEIQISCSYCKKEHTVKRRYKKRLFCSLKCKRDRSKERKENRVAYDTAYAKRYGVNIIEK